MALVIEGLTKRFGTVQALDGVSFAVEPGEISRLPRGERRRQDDDDANRPRIPSSRQRDGCLE